MVAVTQSANEGRTQAITTRSQTQPALPTLLGRQALRIPVGGRIRAGIKVLTKKAEAHAGAREIYERGVAAGKGFEAIEKEIARAVPDLANPLVPRNVPYFTVRGEDFPNPGSRARSCRGSARTVGKDTSSTAFRWCSRPTPGRT